MDLNGLPEDIINHIGAFYITKKMKFLCRIDKINKKVEEMKKRTSDEWIQHINGSKIYRCKITDVKHTKIQYINMWGEKLYIPKSELIRDASNIIDHYILCIYKELLVRQHRILNMKERYIPI